MKKMQLSVSPIVRPDPEVEYDLVVASLGYEERARFVAEQHGPIGKRRIAWAFDSNHGLSHIDNLHYFERAGYEIIQEFVGSPEEWLAAAARMSKNGVIRVCIDISSASRRWLASWVHAMRIQSRSIRVLADIIYSAAEFVPPPITVAPNIWAGPVLPSFAGWADNPALPAVLVLGLGYEPDRAIGAVEYIEPAEVIAFEPLSSQEAFTPAIAAANSQLWGLRPTPRKMVYKVEDPYGTLLLLDQLMGRLVTRSRPVILPFGPKIFAMAALLVAVWYPTVAVWRVSAGPDEEPVQRKPTGEIFGLRAQFASTSI